MSKPKKPNEAKPCKDCYPEFDCWKKPWKCIESPRGINEVYRNGGNPIESREEGRDLISEMSLARSRSDVLAKQLGWMGITPDGDGASDYEEP